MRKSALLLGALACPIFAQSLILSTQQLTFNVPPGIQNSAPQAVTVTPDAMTATTPVSFAVNLQSSPWLRVNNTTSGVINSVTQTGVSLSVTVNSQALISGQNYNGFFTVQIPGLPASQLAINVNVFVGGSSALFAAPPTLAFSAVEGAQVGTPTSRNVTISSNAGPLSFALSTQQTGNWLSITSTGGVTGMPTGTFSVSAVPSGLTPGTYTGTITAQSLTTADQATVSVTLTVTSTTQLTVTPTSLPPFLFQLGGAPPAPKSLSVTSNGGSVPFGLVVTPSAPWLVVSPLSGSASSSTPSAITLTAVPTGLPAGTYNTSLVITPAGGAALAPIPLSLVITANPLLQVSPPSLTFTSQFAGQPPIDQILNLTAIGGSVGFTVSDDSPWLSVIPSANATPAQVTVHVDTAGLSVNSYSGIVTLRPTNGDNYTINVPVSLTISNPLQITASPGTLLFSYQTTVGPPPTQQVQIRSPGLPVQFLVAPSTSTCGSNWLNVEANRNITPATLTVSIATQGLTPGVCNGTVALTFGGVTGQLQISVTVAVSAASLLSINQPPGFGNEIVQQSPFGATAIPYTIALVSSDPSTPVTFTAFATTTVGASGWLTAGPGAGSTPQNLLVSIQPGGLSPGNYSGQVVISSPSFPGALPSGSFALPINLTVNPAVSVSVAPTALAFTHPQLGPFPANQSLTLTSSGGTATFAATITQITGGDWLDVNPKSGTASRDLTVSVKANALPASPVPYLAQITLAFQNSSTPPVTIPVSLTVTNPRTLTVAPQSLSFAFQRGGAVPAAQKLTVSSAGGPVSFTVGTTATPAGWLSADAASGVTPRDLNISVNPGTLAAGTYNGSVSITGIGIVSPITVNVTLTVTASTVPAPVTVTNTASNLPGPIAPGELITIKGTLLGPPSPPNNGLFSLNAQGGVDPILFGVRVLFDGIPGTPIYVSATQINVIAPWEIGGRVNTNIVVEYNGLAAAPIQVRLSDSAPAIYTLDNTGSGRAAALNQDGTLNGPGAPATTNSVLAVYANGGGTTNPASTTGSVSPTTQLLRLTGVTSATIGGVTATIEFIGAAPGLVTGVVQLNIRVPPGVSGANLAITLTINGVSSPAGPTVAVQ